MEETTTLREAKVFQLCKDLEDMINKKKATSKAYNDEIKRIKDEIKDLIEPPKKEDEDI